MTTLAQHTQTRRRMTTACRGLLLALCASGGVAPAADLTLVQDGRSEYRIVLPARPSVTEKKAAEELQSFLRQISGAVLPLVADDQPATDKEIVIGAGPRLAAAGVAVDWKRLGPDGYALKTAGNTLFIVGSDRLGALYGVYGFLEDHLGCRWFSSTVNRIPAQKTIRLGPLDDVQVPAFEFREVYYADLMDPDFAARLKLNGNASTMRDHVMAVERHANWGTWCHTAFSFVPPARYFKDHPEYYSLIGGKRQAQQLCFTNPDVPGIIAARIRELLKQPADFKAEVNDFIPRQGGPSWATGEDLYFDVSQMDRQGNCQCPACQAIDQREGTPMGSLLSCINQVAEQFPDKIISTLSYQYTRRPPNSLRPRDNVSIMLCNIECGRARPIAASPHACDKKFVADIEAWSKISRRLLVWDYSVNFANLLTPMPNLRIQQPNIRFFRDHHVRSYFSQGSREVGGDFAELRAYLIAKLCWNPDIQVSAVMDDFLSGYYGPAAKPIRRYLDLMHDAAEKMERPLGIYDSPHNHAASFLRPELVRQYDALFDEAERLAAADSAALDRVLAARMSLMFAKLQLGMGSAAEQRATAARFFALCRKNHIRRLSESGHPPAEFERAISDRLRKM